jgi:hypothetical protein
MATTVTRSNYWMLKLTSDTTPAYNFKFVVDIWVDGAKFIRLKQPKNNNNSAHINFEKIVKNYIKVTNKHDNTITGSIDYDSIHLIPQNTTDVGTASTPDREDYPLSKNTDTLKTFTFKFYEEYSATADGTVSVSSSSASDVNYPLINYANEWEDKMELDVDLFNFSQQSSLLSNPTFNNTQTQNWTHYSADGVVLSYPAQNRMKMSVLNTGVFPNRIYTGGAEQILGVKYNFKYKIEAKTFITNFKIWNGSAYIDAPFELGWNELIYTCQATNNLYLNIYGTTGGEMLFSFTQFEAVVNKGEFLSELPADTTKGNNTSGKIPHLTSYNDYKTLSFFNNRTAPYATVDGWLEYRFFDTEPIFQMQNGTIFPTNYVGKIEVSNEGNNGGANPSGYQSDDKYVLFAGVGAANVKNIKYPNKGGYQLQEDSSIKYYTVYYTDSVSNSVSTGSVAASQVKQGDRCRILSLGTTDFTLYGSANNNVNTIFYSNSGSITGTGAVEIFSKKQASQTHLFEIASDNNCNSTRFDEYTLGWKNKYGTWDYYMFDGEHTDVRNYKREDQSLKLAGSWGASDFAIESYERGKVQKVGGTKQTTINTRFITDKYNDYFNGLLMSNEVQLLTPVKKGDDDVKQIPIPINIKDTSLTYKTNLKDKLVQYSFTFEYAHDLKKRV